MTTLDEKGELMYWKTQKDNAHYCEDAEDIEMQNFVRYKCMETVTASSK